MNIWFQISYPTNHMLVCLCQVSKCNKWNFHYPETSIKGKNSDFLINWSCVPKFKLINEIWIKVEFQQILKDNPTNHLNITKSIIKSRHHCIESISFSFFLGDVVLTSYPKITKETSFYTPQPKSDIALNVKLYEWDYERHGNKWSMRER